MELLLGWYFVDVSDATWFVVNLTAIQLVFVTSVYRVFLKKS